MSVYEHADKAIKVLNGVMEQEFQNMSVTLRFDELNVIEVRKRVSEMYKSIDRIVRQEFRKVIRKAKRDAEKEVGSPRSDFSAALLLALVLDGYDPVTKYVYKREWHRKRDRLIESLMASSNRQELRQALRRAMNLMALQIGQYADNLTDETRIRVFSAAGVEKVRWHTQHDSRVCRTCEERDGQVYSIYEIPEKHYRCRCLLTPA